MTTAVNLQDAPEGYMRNAIGHLVPESQVREHDKLRDNVVSDIAEQAIEINRRLSEFKKQALDDIADLVSMSAERYGVQIGGKKGNVSITSYNGEYKVVRSMQERLTFTEEMFAARELITSCINRWSEGANDHIRVLVDRAFKTNAKGQVKTSALIDLLRIEINDEEWLQAMQALKDSMQIIGTAIYVRIYKRHQETGEYLPVPLDLAAVHVGGTNE